MAGFAPPPRPWTLGKSCRCGRRIPPGGGSGAPAAVLAGPSAARANLVTALVARGARLHRCGLCRPSRNCMVPPAKGAGCARPPASNIIFCRAQSRAQQAKTDVSRHSRGPPGALRGVLALESGPRGGAGAGLGQNHQFLPGARWRYAGKTCRLPPRCSRRRWMEGLRRHPGGGAGLAPAAGGLAGLAEHRRPVIVLVLMHPDVALRVDGDVVRVVEPEPRAALEVRKGLADESLGCCNLA